MKTSIFTLALFIFTCASCTNTSEPAVMVPVDSVHIVAAADSVVIVTDSISVDTTNITPLNIKK